jgi:hypothetical protein
MALTGLIFGINSVGKNREIKHTKLVPIQTAATCQPIIFTGAIGQIAVQAAEKLSQFGIELAL